MAADKASQLKTSRRFVYGCIAAWIANSAVCVLTNKHILYYLGFSFPTVLAVMHMVSASLATAVLVHCTPNGRCHLPMPGAARSAFYGQLAGIAALFGVVLVLANSAFMYLSVPSIQMLKASGAATTFVVGVLFGTEAYTHRSALKVLIVGLGVVIASYGEMKANLLGVSLQVAAIVSDAIRCNLLQLVMQANEIKLSPVGTLYFVAPMAAVALCVPAALLELRGLINHSRPIPWVWLLASCATASSLNLIVFTLIGKTSALTTSVTGPLKEWVCILTSMLVYGNVVTTQQWTGYAIALSGIFWYQREKFFASQQGLGGKGTLSNGGGSGSNISSRGEEKLPLTQQDALLEEKAAV